MFSLEKTFGFEVTSEDVAKVIGEREGKSCTEERARLILSWLDRNAIEDAALHGVDLDEQTTYAQEEIKRQLGGILRGF